MSWPRNKEHFYRYSGSHFYSEWSHKVTEAVCAHQSSSSQPASGTYVTSKIHAAWLISRNSLSHPFPELEWNTDIVEYAAIDFLSITHLLFLKLQFLIFFFLKLTDLLSIQLSSLTQWLNKALHYDSVILDEFQCQIWKIQNTWLSKDFFLLSSLEQFFTTQQNFS